MSSLTGAPTRWTPPEWSDPDLTPEWTERRERHLTPPALSAGERRLLSAASIMQTLGTTPRASRRRAVGGSPPRAGSARPTTAGASATAAPLSSLSSRAVTPAHAHGYRQVHVPPLQAYAHPSALVAEPSLMGAEGLTSQDADPRTLRPPSRPPSLPSHPPSCPPTRPTSSATSRPARTVNQGAQRPSSPRIRPAEATNQPMTSSESDAVSAW